MDLDSLGLLSLVLRLTPRHCGSHAQTLRLSRPDTAALTPGTRQSWPSLSRTAFGHPAELAPASLASPGPKHVVRGSLAPYGTRRSGPQPLSPRPDTTTRFCGSLFSPSRALGASGPSPSAALSPLVALAQTPPHGLRRRLTMTQLHTVRRRVSTGTASTCILSGFVGRFFDHTLYQYRHRCCSLRHASPA